MSFRYFVKLVSGSLIKIYQKKRLILVFIFCFSILASLSYLIFLKNIGPAGHRVPGSDYLSYYAPVAESISQGKGIPSKAVIDKESAENINQGKEVSTDKYVSFRYPIGYPLILSVLFSMSNLLHIGRLEMIVLFNVLVDAFAVCFLFLIAESIFNKKIAVLSFLLWISYPFNLWFIKNPNTEVPFIFLLYLGIWLYILALKKRKTGLIFLSGVILGFSILVRPIGFLLIPIFALVLFFLLKKEIIKIKFLLAAMFLFGAMIMIFPWEIYLFLKTNQFILLSTNGSSAIVDGLTFDLKPGAGGNQVVVSDDVILLMHRAKIGNLTDFSEIFRFLVYELINRPIPLIKLIGWKAVRSWYATSQMWWEGRILTVQIFYLLSAFWGLIYAIRKFKDKIFWITFFLIIIFYFWLMTISALSIMRYMVPVMGLVIIFSAVALDLVINRLAKNFRSRSLCL